VSAPQLKVVPGRHHDPNEPWSREPQLRTVVELRSHRQPPRVWPWYLTMLALGFAVGLLWR
jgi:hypothetical protein